MIMVFILFSCTGGEVTEKTNKTKAVNQKSAESTENCWLEKFYSDFFLRGSAIYTLFSSKPMSCKEIITATEEEWLKAYSSYMELIPSDRKAQVIEDLKEYIAQYDLDVNWRRWKILQSKNVNSAFLFREVKTESPNVVLIKLINSKEVIKTLFKNYDIFKREVKIDFDPFEVTMEFENLESVFWEKVFNSHLLMGILYGYGIDNAYLFSEERKHKETFAKPIFSRQPFPNEREERMREGGIENLEIPFFVSYANDCEEDPIVAYYKEIRKKIQRQLKNIDLIDGFSKKLLGDFAVGIVDQNGLDSLDAE
ncbi:MAG: hypothetical protein WDZ28_02485 [Simkaniaceae bacterium]